MLLLLPPARTRAVGWRRRSFNLAKIGQSQSGLLVLSAVARSAFNQKWSTRLHLAKDISVIDKCCNLCGITISLKKVIVKYPPPSRKYKGCSFQIVPYTTKEMLVGKFLLVSAISVFALFASQSEAKRKPSWLKKLVHNRCEDDSTISPAIGDEKITKTFMRTVKRLQHKGIDYVSLLMSGKPFVKGGSRKERKRKVSFLKDVAETFSIVLLPWDVKEDLTELKTKKVIKSYERSAKVFDKLIGYKPLAVHVTPDAISRKIVRALDRKDFIVIGNVQGFESSDKTLDRDSLIAVQSDANLKSFRKFMKKAEEDFALEPVSLSTCLAMPIYEGDDAGEADSDEEESDD